METRSGASLCAKGRPHRGGILVRRGRQFHAFGRSSSQIRPRGLGRAVRADLPAEVTLTGLRHDVQYFYRWNGRAAATDEFETTEEFSFRTGRAQGDAFVFTVQSDSHLDGRPDTRLYEVTLRNAKAAGPDFHIDLGDTFMTDKRRLEYRDALPQYLA